MLTKFNEVKKIRNEFEQVRKDFYTKILEIFGIFVAIFSFIIVGFTQIPPVVNATNTWEENFLNASAIFIPLLIVLIILIMGIGIIHWLATRK